MERVKETPMSRLRVALKEKGKQLTEGIDKFKAWNDENKIKKLSGMDTEIKFKKKQLELQKLNSKLETFKKKDEHPMF